ncbi:hypothetical protein [Kitasatospora sp. NPDC058190]|uniref:hypothetical protein n=1 Tax=Kitasatospora sp. NPDC058190 TaxID=3346371 RepID=UPI0036DA911E
MDPSSGYAVASPVDQYPGFRSLACGDYGFDEDGADGHDRHNSLTHLIAETTGHRPDGCSYLTATASVVANAGEQVPMVDGSPLPGPSRRG